MCCGDYIGGKYGSWRDYRLSGLWCGFGSDRARTRDDPARAYGAGGLGRVGAGHTIPTEAIMQPRLKIGVLFSRVRVEEKWIFGAMEKRGIDYDRLDDREIHFDLNDPSPWQQYDAVLERSI